MGQVVAKIQRVFTFTPLRLRVHEWELAVPISQLADSSLTVPRIATRCRRGFALTQHARRPGVAEERGYGDCAELEVPV
jgi:hypothetical protein